MQGLLSSSKDIFPGKAQAQTITYHYPHLSFIELYYGPRLEASLQQQQQPLNRVSHANGGSESPIIFNFCFAATCGSLGATQTWPLKSHRLSIKEP